MVVVERIETQLSPHQNPNAKFTVCETANRVLLRIYQDAQIRAEHNIRAVGSVDLVDALK